MQLSNASLEGPAFRFCARASVFLVPRTRVKGVSVACCSLSSWFAPCARSGELKKTRFVTCIKLGGCVSCIGRVCGGAWDDSAQLWAPLAGDGRVIMKKDLIELSCFVFFLMVYIYCNMHACNKPR